MNVHVQEFWKKIFDKSKFGLEFDSANFNWKFPRKFGQFTETDRTAGSRQRDDDSALSDDVAGGRSDTERQSRRAVALLATFGRWPRSAVLVGDTIHCARAVARLRRR